MLDSQYLSPAELDTLDGVLGSWQAKIPALGLLVLLPENEKARIPALQTACRQRGIGLMGAVFPALVSATGFLTEGAWLVRFAGQPPSFLLDDPGTEGCLAAAAERVLAAATPAGDAAPLLFMIFDGMVPNIGTLLSDLYVTLQRRIKYFGVNAGSESFQPMPCLFDGERQIGGGVLGLVLPAATRGIARHGYPVSQSLMRATATEGNRVASIDGRPALEVYREVMQAEYGISLTRDNFYEHAVHYPFGVVTALDVLVRIPVAIRDDGSIFFIGEIPRGAVLRLLKAPTFGSSLCAEMIASQWAAPEVTITPAVLLTFYCAGRRLHFGKEALSEVARLQTLSGTMRIAGALSLGEIDSDNELGMPRFHNAAVACLA